MNSTDVSTIFCEKCYSPREIAEMWNITEDSVRKLFKKELGVMEIISAGRTLRIPESTLQRVHSKLLAKERLAKECQQRKATRRKRSQ